MSLIAFIDLTDPPAGLCGQTVMPAKYTCTHCVHWILWISDNLFALSIIICHRFNWKNFTAPYNKSTEDNSANAENSFLVDEWFKLWKKVAPFVP
jgi:hypothetical protein